MPKVCRHTLKRINLVLYWFNVSFLLSVKRAIDRLIILSGFTSFPSQNNIFSCDLMHG